jgi:two-component system chemotaxis response regulator CheB
LEEKTGHLAAQDIECIVIGGSAGSIPVVMQIVSLLPASFCIPIVIVLHQRKGPHHFIVEILQNVTHLTVKQAEEKDKIEKGHIYICPPDYHLLVEGDRTFSLDASERVEYSRPSINISFESMAFVYGKKLLGILLSGANADGAAGLYTIEAHEGIVVVQQPSSSEVSYMPEKGIEKCRSALILTPDQMCRFLANL